jgi:hypothetical protein
MLHPRSSRPDSVGPSMLDIVFVAAGVAFFVVGLGYVLLCDRL